MASEKNARQEALETLFPAFIRNDRNCNALANAILKGFECFHSVIQKAVEEFMLVDEMPESRLDELAWEHDCIYNFDDPIEIKRQIIAKAVKMLDTRGTAEDAREAAKLYCPTGEVLEYNQFGGFPFQYLITFSKGTEPGKAVKSAINVSTHAPTRCEMVGGSHSQTTIAMTPHCWSAGENIPFCGEVTAGV